MAKLTAGEQFQGAPAWSPDGKRIAGLVLHQAPALHTTIELFDPATGKRQQFMKLPRTIINSLTWLRDGTGLVSTSQDLNLSITNQLHLHSYPGARTTRVTNDFNDYEAVSASLADETIAALRTIAITNLWIADVSGGPARQLTLATNPENAAYGAEPLDSSTVIFGGPQDR